MRLRSWVTKEGYKDGLQPETLADGNWLVKQNFQPVSKIEKAPHMGVNVTTQYDIRRHLESTKRVLKQVSKMCSN
jgi:hypothetical protein